MNIKTTVRMASILALAMSLLVAAKPVVAQSQNPQALSWFSLGIKEKDAKKKIAFYSKAIELDPLFVEAHYNLGLAYKLEQNYARAEQALQRALNAKPGKLDTETKFKILYELGTTYKRLGKLKESEEALRGAKAIGSGAELQANLALELGRLLSQQSRYDEALAELLAGRNANPAYAGEFSTLIQFVEEAIGQQKLFDLAEKARASGNLQQAKSLYEQIRAKNSTFKGLQEKLAEVDSLLSETVNKQNIAAMYDQAQKHLTDGNLEMAIIAYESLLQQSPNYKDAAIRLQKAREQLEQKQFTDKVESEYATGLALLKAQDWTRAVISFERVVSMDRNFREARRRLADAKRGLEKEGAEIITTRYYADGVASMNQNDLGRALEAFEKVKANNPNYRNVMSLIADIESRLGEKAPSLSLASLDSLYQSGVASQEMRDWLQAIVAFEKMQVLRPNYRDVSERLAHSRGQLQTAGVPPQASSGSLWASPLYLGGAMVGLVVIPLLGIMMLSPGARARYHLLRGRYADAVNIYERLLVRKPERVKLYPALANLYLLMGRHDERAMKVYKMVLQLNLATSNRDEINANVAQHYLSEGRTDSDAIEVLENLLMSEQRKHGKMETRASVST